jgi:phosphoribosylaminoimidazolecarboxamide formyltransferase/IMP cyclohydrolase
LRYGENPHQKAWYYRKTHEEKGDLTQGIQLHGKELSFNNINDTNAALEVIREFKAPTVVALKHANPCGVATGKTLHQAYKGAYECDPVSIFGGIIALNRRVDVATAEEINRIFLEIIIAPDYDEDALNVLKGKKNIRILKLDGIGCPLENTYDIKNISGGLLIQEHDNKIYMEEDFKVVTKKTPTDNEMESLKFAMKVVKHVKSNGIVVAKDSRTIGIGPGQVNRIWAVDHALNQSIESTQGAVLASDAFFPFEDCVERAKAGGITAIIQPGGSLKDEESIKKADELEIAMVFTGMRHFKH